MIKITDTLAIDQDRYNWILINKADRNRKSFHPTLEQCLRAARDIEAKSAVDLEALFSVLQRSYRLDHIAADQFLKRAVA